MPATATAMVKAIWRTYFQIQGAGTDVEADADADDDAPVARAVEEVGCLSACTRACRSASYT